MGREIDDEKGREREERHRYGPCAGDPGDWHMSGRALGRTSPQPRSVHHDSRAHGKVPGRPRAATDMEPKDRDVFYEEKRVFLGLGGKIEVAKETRPLSLARSIHCHPQRERCE